MANAEEATATVPPLPDPKALQPGGLSNKHKRWMFYGIAAVVGFIVLANIVGTNPTKPARIGPPSRADQMQNPSAAQIQDWQSNLNSAQARLQEAQHEREVRDKAAAQARVAGDQQQVDVSRGAPEGSYTGGGVSPEASQQAQMKAEHEQRAYRALFADNLVQQDRPAQAKADAVPAPPMPPAPAPMPAAEPVPSDRQRKPLDFDPKAQSTYWLPEGTVVEAVLTNRLDGDGVGPVNVMTTTDVYLPGTQLVVIPQGARILGEASKVASFGQQRLAVAFHRVIIPGLHPYSIPLDREPPALGQAGEVGLHDKVNSHYASIFGASLAIGAIGGLAQIGNTTSGFGYDPGVQFRSGVSQSTAQSADRVLDRFLNRMPTITIREGTRVKILLTDDLQVPSFNSMHTQGGF